MLCSISGANCVGKSTLIKRLNLDEIESSRILSKSFDMWSDNLDTTQLAIFINDLSKIIKYKNHSRTIFLDRSLLDSLVFNRYFYNNGKISKNVYDFITETALNNLKYIDKMFYIDPEFPIKDDGFRITDSKFQEDLVKLYHEIIKEYNIDVIKLSGDVENRISQIHKSFIPEQIYL